MKPILFNTEMVQAVLDGRKTVTRRVVNHKHLRGLENLTAEQIQRACIAPCRPGDILYVRETWAQHMDGTFMFRAFTGDANTPKKLINLCVRLGIDGVPQFICRSRRRGYSCG